MDLESPWDEDIDHTSVRQSEWTKISNEFTDVGYREGITAGKEASVQEGFDAGFADVGVPIGRDLGLLRGRANALLGFLTLSAQNSGDAQTQSLVAEARAINAALGRIRFSDIEPPDEEALRHARQHELETGRGNDAFEIENEEMRERKDMERVEDMMARMSAGVGVPSAGRPTREDVVRLKERFEALVRRAGLEVNWS